MDTKTAKPNAVSETPTAEKPYTLLYCILCEKMVDVKYGTACGMGHELTVPTEEGIEIDYCCFEGGYAFTPPPAADSSDWAAQDISEEERAQAELEEMGKWLS